MSHGAPPLALVAPLLPVVWRAASKRRSPPFPPQHLVQPLPRDDPARIVGDGGIREVSREDSWTFEWSRDGEAVAACLAGTVLAFVASDNSLGYARHLLEPSDFGFPWNVDLYQRLFHAAG